MYMEERVEWRKGGRIYAGKLFMAVGYQESRLIKQTKSIG